MVVSTGTKCAAWMVALFYAGCVHGQSPCKLTDVPLKEEFDINRFMGTWYEILWISPSYNDGGDLWINYYHVYNADDYGVVTGYYSGKDPNTGQCFLGGIAILQTTDHPAKLLQYSQGSKALRDYWILKTDYTSYAIAYACLERAANSSDTCKLARSWLWSRTKSLPDQVTTDARNTFQSLCMNMTLLYTTEFRGEDCVPDTSGSPASVINGSASHFLLFITVLAFSRVV